VIKPGHGHRVIADRLGRIIVKSPGFIPATAIPSIVTNREYTSQ